MLQLLHVDIQVLLAVVKILAKHRCGGQLTPWLQERALRNSLLVDGPQCSRALVGMFMLSPGSEKRMFR